MGRGTLPRSTSIFGRIAQDYPLDLLALQNGHVGCFFTGRQFDLRDWPMQAMRAHRRSDEGWHAILGMAAFGHEECGDYVRAESLGEEAIDAEPPTPGPRTPSPTSTKCAAIEEGRAGSKVQPKAGPPIAASPTTTGGTSPCCISMRRTTGAAIALYDQRIRPNDESNLVLELIDASAMLWRLHLDGVDTGDRFARLAKVWEQKIEDGVYAFNDLHAVMVFLGAGRDIDAERTLASCAASRGPGRQRRHDPRGRPAAGRGVHRLAAGRYAEAVEKIAPVRGLAQRFGGSHAQRDVLSLTALHAAVAAA